MTEDLRSCFQEIRNLRRLTFCLGLICALMAISLALGWTHQTKSVQADAVPDELRAKSIVIVDDSGHQLARLGQATDASHGNASVVKFEVSSVDGSGSYNLEIANRQGQSDGWISLDMYEDLVSNSLLRSGRSGENHSVNVGGGSMSVYTEVSPKTGATTQARAYLLGTSGGVGVKNCTNVPSICGTVH